MTKLLHLILLVLFSTVALCQTAVVKRNVTLRPDPSTDNDAITTLRPHTKLHLMEPQKTNGYLHVTVGGREGWVWARNVSMEENDNDEVGTTHTTATSGTVGHCIEGTARATHVGPPQLYPPSQKTPGCADTLLVSDLTRRYTENCPRNKSDCTYSQSHRSVSSIERTEVYDNYAVPEQHRNGQDGEVDHFYPLCAGGSNDLKNLWYQPADNEWNGKNYGFHEKDRLETYICAQIKVHKMDPKEAFDRLTNDWVKFYIDEGLDSDD